MVWSDDLPGNRKHTGGEIPKDTPADFTSDLYISIPVVSGGLLQTLRLLKSCCIPEHMNRGAHLLSWPSGDEVEIHCAHLAQVRILETFFRCSRYDIRRQAIISMLLHFINQRYQSRALVQASLAAAAMDTRGSVRVCIWQKVLIKGGMSAFIYIMVTTTRDWLTV